MSAFDYNRLGEARIRADRAEAKLERLAEIGDRMAKHLHGLGPVSNMLRDEWAQGRAWDGCPVLEKAHPAARRGVKGEIS